MSNQLLTYTKEEGILSTIPLERSGTSSDISAAAIWLISRGGSFVTGQIIAIDGGSVINIKPAKL